MYSIVSRASLTIWHQQTAHCHCRALNSALSLYLLSHVYYQLRMPYLTHLTHTQSGTLTPRILVEHGRSPAEQTKSLITEHSFEEKEHFSEFIERCRYNIQSQCSPQSSSSNTSFLGLCPLRRQWNVCHLFLNFVPALAIFGKDLRDPSQSLAIDKRSGT